MTFIISATFVLAVAYIAIALVARIHDSIAARYAHRNTIEVLPTVIQEEPTPQPLALPEPTAPIVTIPTKYDDLRQYVRDHSLQSAVKKVSGKSVSKLTRQELFDAVSVAIA